MWWAQGAAERQRAHLHARAASQETHGHLHAGHGPAHEGEHAPRLWIDRRLRCHSRQEMPACPLAAQVIMKFPRAFWTRVSVQRSDAPLIHAASAHAGLASPGDARGAVCARVCRPRPPSGSTCCRWPRRAPGPSSTPSASERRPPARRHGARATCFPLSDSTARHLTHVRRPLGTSFPVVVAFAGGEFAWRTESLTDEVIIAQVTQRLQTLFKDAYVAPTDVVITRCACHTSRDDLVRATTELTTCTDAHSPSAAGGAGTRSHWAPTPISRPAPAARLLTSCPSPCRTRCRRVRVRCGSAWSRVARAC